MFASECCLQLRLFRRIAHDARMSGQRTVDAAVRVEQQRDAIDVGTSVMRSAIVER